jgi:hypothetical protein
VDLNRRGGLEVEVAPDDGEQLLAHPVEAGTDLAGALRVRLERPELLGGECTRIRLVGMLLAERDHPARVVVFALTPGRVEVVPGQVRASQPSTGQPKPTSRRSIRSTSAGGVRFTTSALHTTWPPRQLSGLHR